jgi:Ca-activated chloride channel family protein
VLPRISISQIAFSQPEFLWLLAVPALLVVVWMMRFITRRAELGRLMRDRVLPVRERFAFAGDLPFWLCLVAAIALAIVAVARPHGPAQAVRTGGVDLVILADGSASMRTKDVAGDRWQRAMRFVRLLGDSLTWKDDRVAMALFAHIATPQIRLTRDPNTFFFFLDHLDQAPPFRLEDDTTWDTNLELGVYWGLRVVERDEDLHGKSSNAKLFVLLSDGESWSGEVAKSLQKANSQQIPIFCVGVGSLAGGPLPLAALPPGTERDPDEPTTSHLDRESLQKIAVATNGQYFELDRDGDRHIANAIIDAGKRLAPSLGVVQQSEELYWWFLCGAGAFLALGMLFVRERAELWLELAGAVTVLLLVTRWLQ